jgi:hypothetical protein
VPVAFLLLAPVQDHGDAENQDSIEADDTKGCGEDKVKVLVRKRGEGADAAALLRGDERVDASVILDEGRRGRIKVSAAIKLGSVSAVFGIASASGRWNACAEWRSRPSLSTCWIASHPWQQFTSNVFCCCCVHFFNAPYASHQTQKATTIRPFHIGLRTFCCNKLCISGTSRAQTVLRAARVCSVSTQMATPRPSVKVAQKMTSQPCARSQPRLVGRKRAGSDRRKVTKMKMALTTAAAELLVMHSNHPKCLGDARLPQ